LHVLGLAVEVRLCVGDRADRVVVVRIHVPEHLRQEGRALRLLTVDVGLMVAQEVCGGLREIHSLQVVLILGILHLHVQHCIRNGRL